MPKNRSISEHPEHLSFQRSPSQLHSPEVRRCLTPGCSGSTGGLTRGAALPVTPNNGWDINAAGTVHIWGYHMAAEQLWQEFPTISLLQASAPATEFGAEVFQHTHLSSNFFSFEIIKSTLQNILFGMILKNSKQSKLLSFFKKNRLNSLIAANNIWDFRVWIYFFITAELWTPKSEV